jgi:LmbE family N-acetylglucosaminyl deacetylase
MNPGSVLVVAAHADDEALGCGGTIARLTRAGSVVHVAFLADGVTARPGEAAGHVDALRERRAAAEKACAVLGVAGMSYGEFPDNRLDTVPLLSIVQSIEPLLRRHRPEMVITHHAGDLNVDHRRTHEAVAVACRPLPGASVRTLLAFEVPSSTEWQPAGSGPAFVPNWFNDISGTLDVKLAALDAYGAEMRAWPHARSRAAVEHLARWRGATIGVAAAEAFVLGRCIS